jgi:hypothetical protein
LESKTDLFRENINLIIQNLEGQKINDLNSYTELSEGQIKTAIENSTIIQSKRINVLDKKGENNEYHQMIFTGTQGTFKLKFE